LRQAAEVRPAKYKALAALAQFYLAGDHPNLGAAEAPAQAAAELNPGRVDAYAVLAAVYADRGEWSSLDSILATALREVPDDAAPHYRAAERLLAAGRDPGRAERYLRVYLAQEPEGNQPTTADARWKLGLALEAQGRVTGAVAEFQESLRLDPESKAARELSRLRAAQASTPGNPTRHM
jgi:tetratricopeptide (TPR) repeat protein